MFNYSFKDVGKIAAEKVAILNWRPYAWELIKGGCLVQGCVPSGRYLSGKKKGQWRFDKPVQRTDQKIFISDIEIETAALRFETVSNNCWDCKGSGKVFSGWSRDKGTKYKKCPKCDGTGIAENSQISI